MVEILLTTGYGLMWVVLAGSFVWFVVWLVEGHEWVYNTKWGKTAWISSWVAVLLGVSYLLGMAVRNL